MMLILLLAVASAAGDGLPPMPDAPATASGECLRSLPLSKGSSVPVALVDDAGLARCSAVCEPLASYAHLLQLEQHAILVRRLYEIDTHELKASRDRWRTEAENATSQPWHQAPWFVAVTTTALVTGALVTYDLSTRSTQ